MPGVLKYCSNYLPSKSKY